MKDQKVLVYSSRDGKHIYAVRTSNRTILVRKDKLTDSDQQIITDKYGHRYTRQPYDIATMEYYTEGYYYFTMI